MAFPSSSPSNAVDAVTFFRNRLVNAGYTPASTLSMQGALYSAVANLLVAEGLAAGDGGTVTQATSASTGVTLNKPVGQIVTVALTTAAAAEERFTVTNSAVAAKDIISLSTTYNGAGTPMLGVLNVAAGAFDIVITNLHAANALNAAMTINFIVKKGQTA